MKSIFALASVALLASCSTHPWMVGSANDKAYCADDDFPGGGPVKIEEVEAAPPPAPGPYVDQSGK